MIRVPTIVTNYLESIDRYPLLNPEKEVELSRKVQKMISICGAPSENKIELENYSLEEQEIIREGLKAYQTFTTSNLRLVVAIAKRRRHNTLEFIDLIEFGNMGLMRAVEKFDTAMGHRFSTYAYWWIQQFIQRGVANTSRTIRLPLNITDNMDKINRCKSRYFSEHGVYPTIKQISELTKLKESEIITIYNADKKLVSINQYFYHGDEELSPENIIGESEENTELEGEELIDTVQNVLSEFDEIDRKIIFSYWVEDKKIKDISKTLSIPKTILSAKISLLESKLKSNPQLLALMQG